MTVLYITQDGITDHIGQSQVAPYIIHLAEIGYDIHVLSAEKAGRETLIEQYRRIFDDAGIRWTIIRYHNRPPLISTAYDLLALYRRAEEIIKGESVSVVHCRGHLAAFVGQHLKQRHRSKLIFDFRDFWLDVRIDRGRFPWVYRALKALEPRLIKDSDHIVTLTQRAVEILRKRYPDTNAHGSNIYTIIPCCADFSHFHIDEKTSKQADLIRSKISLDIDQTVLLYLGSLGVDYLLNQKMALFLEVLSIYPNAVMLFVSNNGEELVRRAAAVAGVPSDNIRFANAKRDHVPAYIALADLAVVFINPLHKEGCSPTKLAELFACNVPVIANTGVGDLDTLLSLGVNGSVVVADFEPATLREAIVAVLRARDQDESNKIREASWGFSLEEGVRRYQAVYAAVNEFPLRSTVGGL